VTFPSFTRIRTTIEPMVLTLFPHGGQGAARRNAWSAMSSDAAKARARRDAAAVMDRAIEHAARKAQPSAL
jgi:hypothetical protein